MDKPPRCSSPKKRKLKDITALVNEPRILRTEITTFSYGETPTTVCRRHFEEMASHYKVSVETLAEDVLKGSLAQQLLKLAEFYKSKYKAVEAVYTPLIEQATKEVFNNNFDNYASTCSTADSRKLKSKGKTPEKKLRIANSSKLKRNTVTECSVANNPSKERALSNQHQPDDNNSSAEHSKSEDRGSSARETQNIDQTILNQPEFIQQAPTSNPDGTFNPQSKSTTDGLNTPHVTPSETEVNLTTSQPSTSSVNVVTEKRETKEELEAFLFGDIPYVLKTPPRKKLKKQAEVSTPDSPQKPNEESSSSPGFMRPSLTFDPYKWSPSKQRDLLSIAKDVAKLQRSLEAGELPEEPVSKLVPFTNPSGSNF